MKKLNGKVIIRKFIALLLLVVLCTASLSETAFAAPLSHKNVTFYFKNMTTEEDKEILKQNFYFYNVTKDEYIYPTDENILVNPSGQYAGCFYMEFTRLPIEDEIGMYNKHNMQLWYNKGENGANIYYSVYEFNLSVDGNIIDTIYGYGMGLRLPYDGTEAILQKENLRFTGWFDNGGNKIAEAENGYVDINRIRGEKATLYAGWTDHMHVWSTVWSSNTLAHWHECEGTVGTCDITGNLYKDGYATHDFSGESKVVTEPDCENNGLTRIYCSQEGCPVYTETEQELLGHLEDSDWTYDDINHWNKCLRDNCNEKFHIDAHEMGEWKTTGEPTYDKVGTKERKCNTCDYTEREDVPVLEREHIHNFAGTEEYINVESCTKKGLKRIHCIDNECSEYVEQDIEPLGHLVEDEWSHNETHHYKICQRCETKDVEETHTFGEWECKKEATNKEDGLEISACKVCGYEVSRSIEYVAKEPTTEKEEPTTEKKEELTTEKEETTTEKKEDEISDVETIPSTSDNTPVKIYATLAMIAGFTYLLTMFGERIFGMSEEQKDDIVGRLIRWGKNKNWIKKKMAMALIFIVLLYYHAIGKNIPTETWSEINEH